MNDTFNTSPELLQADQRQQRSSSDSVKILPHAPEITVPQIAAVHYIPTARQIGARLAAIRSRFQQFEEIQ